MITRPGVLEHLGVLVIVLCITGCVAPGPGDPKVFKRFIESDVAHGRSVDLVVVGENFQRSSRVSPDGRLIWLFVNDQTGCKFEYITDATGRGIGYRYLSPEDACYIERRFRGW